MLPSSDDSGDDDTDPVKRPRASNYGHFYSPRGAFDGPRNGILFLRNLPL